MNHKLSSSSSSKLNIYIYIFTDLAHVQSQVNRRLTKSSSNFPRYGQTGAGKTYTLYGTPQEDHWSCRESTPCCKGAMDGNLADMDMYIYNYICTPIFNLFFATFFV